MTVIRGYEVFKVYKNSDTDVFDLYNPARAIHAEIDFNEAIWLGGLKPLDEFFNRFSKNLPMEHAYWITYRRLYEEHKSRMAKMIGPKSVVRNKSIYSWPN